MMTMLRAVVDKIDSMQEQMGKVSRNGNPKKVAKRNARNQKHCNRNEECL